MQVGNYISHCNNTISLLDWKLPWCRRVNYATFPSKSCQTNAAPSMPALHKMHLCGKKTKKNQKKKPLNLTDSHDFSVFLSVFFDSSPPHPTKPPQKNITTSTYPAEPTSVACVLRSSNRCCRKARAKRNSELSTPATYGGRHQTSDFLTEPWRKEPQKKDLNSFSGGGGCWVLLGEEEILGGELLFVGWLI